MPTLTLYSIRDNEVPTKSGLNWCHSLGNVSNGDACLPLYSDYLRTHPNFFPPHGNEISVIWDDGTEMILLLEGTQLIDGITFPKQISTSNNKSILGRYLRARLGVSLTHTITRNDLRRYGREDINVTYDSILNIYLFDFHI